MPVHRIACTRTHLHINVCVLIRVIMKFTYIMPTAFENFQIIFHKVSFIINTFSTFA
jgi:hypothetical protein